MTEPQPTSSAKPPVFYHAAVDDEIAPDLPTLMERIERARKFLRIESEYIKLIIIGLAFVIGAAVIQHTWLFRSFVLLVIFLTPWAHAWLRLPVVRLANTFRNEVLPFLLRDYGRWNYAIEGRHFSNNEFFRLGFADPTDGLRVTSVITGERFGVPLQMAVIGLWRAPAFFFFRGHKAILAGWAANIRLPGLQVQDMLIIPLGEKPRDPRMAGWSAHPYSPTHQIWVPAGGKPEVPLDLSRRLMSVMADAPLVRFAFAAGVLWLMVPGDNDRRFELIDKLSQTVNEPDLYQTARTQLAEMFAVIDKVVWPSKT
jgi:hypothetical protein